MGEARRRVTARQTAAADMLPRSEVNPVTTQVAARSSGKRPILVPQGNLAVRLERWRAAAGLTKVQAARVFDVDVLTWYRWVRGGEPAEGTRGKLHRVLEAARKAPAGGAGQLRRIGDAGAVRRRPKALEQRA